MDADKREFIGHGTLLAADLIAFTSFEAAPSPDDVLALLKRYHTMLFREIADRGGLVYQFVGDAVLAYWGPEDKVSDHAQRAFEAARAIVRNFEREVVASGVLRLHVDIVLATDEMCAAWFGPHPQFQIIGKVMAMLTRIGQSPRLSGDSAIRMSHYTAAAISEKDLTEIGSIERETLEPVRVLMWPPLPAELAREVRSMQRGVLK